MKELSSAVILLVGMLWAGYETKHLFDVVRTAALAKTAQGLPSLSDFNRKLHERKPVHNKKARCCDRWFARIS